MTYENLIVEAENEGIQLKEKKLEYNLKGLYYNKRIIIDNEVITECEKKCILSEELGHYHKTVGDITDQNKLENRKQEIVARRWGYKKLVGIVDLINAHDYGCGNRYEIAQYLNVTEEFLEETLEYYKCKYEKGYKIDNYWINFSNGLEVLKVF